MRKNAEQPGQTDILLIALRHLQKSISDGISLDYLSELGNVSVITPEQIDCLCETLNLGMNTENESYRVIVMSTAHLTLDDDELLTHLARPGDCRDEMIMSRKHGYLLKMTSEINDYLEESSFSNELNNIIRWADQAGYQMIEFDGDADILPYFPVFEWS